MGLVGTNEGGVHEGLDDAELILRSSREPELFGLLFERHAEAMLAYFARRTLDAESAAELVAETFAEAFSSRRRFRDEGVDGVGWLYGIGKHLLSRYFRAGAVEARARRRLGMPERTVSDDDYDRIEELIDFERFGEALAEAMSVLPEEQREAVEAAGRRRAELRRGRGGARMHRTHGSDARQPGPPTDRRRPRDRPVRRTDRTGAETMATTIEYLNAVHGDLLDAAEREAARRPASALPPDALERARGGRRERPGRGGAHRPDRAVRWVRIGRGGIAPRAGSTGATGAPADVPGEDVVPGVGVEDAGGGGAGPGRRPSRG